MAVGIKKFNDFSYGMADRKWLARGDSNIRDRGFLHSENVFISNSGSIVPRPGTKLVKDFGEFANIKCVPFSRGDNQRYVLVFKEGEQQIYYIDDDGMLVDARQDEVEKILIPEDLESNTDKNFNIVSLEASADAYKCFSSVGYDSTNIYSLDITFPEPITIFRVNMESGLCASLQATFYKSTGESFSATAKTPAQSYACRSCGGSSCRDYQTSGTRNETSYTFEFPSQENTYDDIKRVVLVAKYYKPYTSGNFPQNYTSCVRLENGHFKKLQIVGTDATGLGAVWHYNLPVDVMKKANWSITSRYIFFANQEITPYVISIFGAFVFNPINANFPTDYNFTTMGYPDVVCCGQSRLWYAGFKKENVSIIGSKVGYNLTELQNFNPDFETDGAYLPSSAVKFQPIDIKNSIEWIIAATTINFGSWDGIYKMTYGQGQPVSATGATVLKQNEDTAGEVYPTWYNGAMVFSTISSDEVRLMDYNMITERQESIVISRYHQEINSKGIKKLIFQKDANNYLYILYQDGTGAMCKIQSREVQGYYPFSIADGIDDMWTVKTNRGEILYFVVENGNNTCLLKSDFVDYPKYPIQSENTAEFMEDVAGWVQDKAMLDVKVVEENIIYCDATIPLTIGKLRTDNPEQVPNLTDTYPVWCEITNLNTDQSLDGKTIIGEDELGTLYDFRIMVRSINGFVFGVPYGDSERDAEWENENSPDFAFQTNQYYIGITSLKLKYNEATTFVSWRKYLGEYCVGGTCEDNSLPFIIDPVDGLPVVSFEEPVARVVYGRPYRKTFTFGYIQQESHLATRLITMAEFNTYASWGLKCKTDNQEKAIDLYLIGLQNRVGTDNIAVVNDYLTNNSVYGLTPPPMRNFERVDIEDDWTNVKNFTVWSEEHYPFEIFNISLMLNESDSRTGEQ